MKQINIRIEDGEFKHIQAEAKKLGLTPTEAVKKIVAEAAGMAALEERLIERIKVQVDGANREARARVEEMAQIVAKAANDVNKARVEHIEEMTKLVDSLIAENKALIKETETLKKDRAVLSRNFNFASKAIEEVRDWTKKQDEGIFGGVKAKLTGRG